jgi:hypothetical protein
MVNQRPGKTCRELSIEDKSMATGWRKERMLSTMSHA